MQKLLDTVMSAQRQFQGLLAGHMLDLFGSVDRFTLGMAVAVALDLVHALTPGHGKAVIFSHSHAPAGRASMDALFSSPKSPIIERMELEKLRSSPTIIFNRSQIRYASTSVSDGVGVTGIFAGIVIFVGDRHRLRASGREAQSSNDERSYCFGVGVSVPPSQPPAYPITNKTTITAITPYQRLLFLKSIITSRDCYALAGRSSFPR
jgi:hypothetical protein